MKKITYLFLALMFTAVISKAQTTAYQFNTADCSGNMHDLFADLDAGKAVILHFYMANCSSCPPPAQKIQAMANHINATHPGMVKGYAFPYTNGTTCAYSSSWVSTNNLSALYTAMDSGATQVAYYGGFGMPTVVLLGGADHRIMFSTLSFSTSDTTIMRDSILNLLTVTSVNELPNSVSAFSIYPNPATENVSITLELKEISSVQIDILDITGKVVATIVNEKQSGLVKEQYNTANLANGKYLVRLQVNGKIKTEQLTVTH